MDFQIIHFICSSLFFCNFSPCRYQSLYTLPASPKFRQPFFSFLKMWGYPTLPISWFFNFKRSKSLQLYETLFTELQLEDKYNYKNYLRMTFENFEEIFQLIKDGITKQNTKIRIPISPKLWLATTVGFLSAGEWYKSYVYEYYFFYPTMDSSTFTSFPAFVFSIFFSYPLSDFFYSPQNFFTKKQITWFKLYSLN